MKLTTGSIIIAAAIELRTNGVTGASIVDRHVKSIAAPHLFPGAQYGIEVDASEKSWGEIATTRKDRSFGRAWLGKSFLREMREFAGVNSPDLVSSSGDVFYNMRMTHIVETSPLHTDAIVDGGGRVSAGLSQGFYVLNDNPHAYFETNDDELCIPIMKGNFITFNGHRPHRTVIIDGSVDLLGPFDLHSLKCVAEIKAAFTASGSVHGRKDKRRQLGNETDTERLISGQVFRGIKTDGNTDEIIQHKLAHNVTGLPHCSNCNMSIAFSNAQECTKETHDEATLFIPSQSDLTYSTDDEGNTGVKHNQFITDSEHPTGEQFLAFAKNVFEDPTQVQDSKFSVFFNDEEGELVACSFLQPILSDEEKELAAKILAIINADLESMSSGYEGTPIGEGGNNAGSLMFSFLPMIVVSAAAFVFFSS